MGTRLPTTPIKYQQTKDYEAYTKIDINQLLGYLDKPLEKLYVIVAAESGLRADKIPSLKIMLKIAELLEQNPKRQKFTGPKDLRDFEKWLLIALIFVIVVLVILFYPTIRP